MKEGVQSIVVSEGVDEALSSAEGAEDSADRGEGGAG
jgi:hypothetical protein